MLVSNPKPSPTYLSELLGFRKLLVDFLREVLLGLQNSFRHGDDAECTILSKIGVSRRCDAKRGSCWQINVFVVVWIGGSWGGFKVELMTRLTQEAPACPWRQRLELEESGAEFLASYRVGSQNSKPPTYN